MKLKILIFIFSFGIIYSSETNRYSAQIGIGLLYSQDKFEVPYIYGSDDCGLFDSNDKFSWDADLKVFYTLYDNIRLSGLLGFINKYISQSEQSADYLVFNPGTNDYEKLLREIDFNSSIGFLKFGIGIDYQLLDNIPISIYSEILSNYPIIDTKFKISEKIIKPKGFVFPDGKLQRTISNNVIENLKNHFMIGAGLNYEYKLNPENSIVFDLGYYYGLNKISEEFKWSNNHIKVGLAFRWNFSEPVAEKLPELDTITPIRQEEQLVKLDTNYDTKITAHDLKLNRTIVTQTYPILPYIFFDSTSANIRNIYNKNNDIEKFNEINLPKETLPIYYNILDIIGSRLKTNPSAKLTIIGTSDGEEFEKPDDRLLLAEQRAESIKKYLVEKWKIDKHRLNTKSQNMPGLPTSREYRAGYEENRRAELYSDNPKILAPVVHEKFFEYQIKEYPEIDINTNFETKAWKLELVDNDSIIYEKTALEAAPIKLRTVFNKKHLNNVSSKNKIKGKYQFSNDSKSLTGSFDVPISIMDENFELGRLNLIVFDFDKSDISDFNKEIIRNFVKSSIFDKSLVRITGSTDILGERQYNKKLSEDRANTVADYLKKIVTNINIKDIKGTGAETIKYDNNLPEGRFYSRTVLIEIESPLK